MSSIQRQSKSYKILFKNQEPIDIAEAIKYVASPKCGAINTFSGTIRDTDYRPSAPDAGPRQLEPIQGIYYESYQDMAVLQIVNIVDEVLVDESSNSIDTNSRVFVGVRLGFVPVGEASLIICVSSTSRSFSHQATMTILEKIKSSVTIWKKVVFDECDEEWADASKSEAYWLNKQRNTGNDNAST